MRRKTAKPSESPICVSRITSEGDPVDARVTPSSAVDAVMTSNPSIDRVAARESRVRWSSSMMRMTGASSSGSFRRSTSRNVKAMATP